MDMIQVWEVCCITDNQNIGVLKICLQGRGWLVGWGGLLGGGGNIVVVARAVVAEAVVGEHDL